MELLNVCWHIGKFIQHRKHRKAKDKGANNNYDFNVCHPSQFECIFAGFVLAPKQFEDYQSNFTNFRFKNIKDKNESNDLRIVVSISPVESEFDRSYEFQSERYSPAAR